MDSKKSKITRDADGLIKGADYVFNEDGLIDWNKPLSEIHNFVKALTKPYPGAFSFIDKQKIMIWEAQPFDTKISFPNSRYGEVVEKFSSGDFVVKCVSGLLLITSYEGNVEREDTFSNL